MFIKTNHSILLLLDFQHLLKDFRLRWVYSVFVGSTVIHMLVIRVLDLVEVYIRWQSKSINSLVSS